MSKDDDPFSFDFKQVFAHMGRRRSKFPSKTAKPKRATKATGFRFTRIKRATKKPKGKFYDQD